LTYQIKPRGSNHLNRTITSNETEVVIKRLPAKKSPEPYIFTAQFYQSFKELTPILLILFQKQKGKEHYQTHSMKPVSHSFQNQTRTQQK
jgi:hypothetical protein